jgi:pentatricopeptide repeat domain-containing protein 1
MKNSRKRPLYTDKLQNKSNPDILVSGWSKLRIGTDQVRKFLKDMKEKGLNPSKGTINSICRAFSKPGMSWEARRLLRLKNMVHVFSADDEFHTQIDDCRGELLRLKGNMGLLDSSENELLSSG